MLGVIGISVEGAGQLVGLTHYAAVAGTRPEPRMAGDWERVILRQSLGGLWR